MYDYQRPTDSAHKIELPSEITQALWDRTMASIGDEVEFRVQTHFVGNYNEAKITFRNRNGKKLDEATASVYGNRCKGMYTIPDKANEAVYYEVEFRSLGLKSRSDELIIGPPRTITNAQWSMQEARRGDILTLSANVSGFNEGDRATISILEYDEDGAHDPITEISVIVNNSRVEAEWEYEYHEDTDEIPTESEIEKGYNPPEYIFRVRIDNISADSGLLLFKDWIEVEVKDATGQTAANQDYIIHLPDEQTRSGTTDDRGWVREEDVPPGPWWIELVSSDSGS
jgi:hypothetical protein